jgi:hypothetical protein
MDERYRGSFDVDCHTRSWLTYHASKQKDAKLFLAFSVGHVMLHTSLTERLTCIILTFNALFSQCH